MFNESRPKMLVKKFDAKAKEKVLNELINGACNAGYEVDSSHMNYKSEELIFIFKLKEDSGNK